MTTRQKEIIDAALRLTAEGGIQNLTVKNLSAAIGVTEPALYRHFRNKAEIVKAMIGRFDAELPVEKLELSGWAAIAAFVRGRFEQVVRTPELARVMFAEELFLDEPEFSEQLTGMMHRHKTSLAKYFAEAVAAGEIRSGIAPDILFRLVIGPVRLLVKQWGMTRGAFDLRVKGDELLVTLHQLLKGENHETNHH